MPNADLIYNCDCCGTADRAVQPAGQKPGCDCGNVYFIPPPPPDFPPPYPPYPPYPPPYPPFPPCPPEPTPEPKQGSTESKICKLSKKAAVINKMIDFVENKKKDVIIKTGGVSYNFGNIDLEVNGWEAENEGHSYADTVLVMLQHERALIMAEIKELSDELDDEATGDGSIPETDGGNGTT